MPPSIAASIEKVSYAGWPNCYRLSNGEVELIVTADVGPRIIRYAFVGGQNLFKEFDDQLGQSGEREWRPRGGHRIWIAPEDRQHSYAADNAPVAIGIDADTLTATAPVEAETGLQKRLIVRLAPAGSRVDVVHTITNAAGQARRLAPWALTMLAPGGTGVHGFPRRGTHPEQLAPSNPLVMWAFTDLSDPRWTFTSKYLILRQDPLNSCPQKLGSFHESTFGAYLLSGDLFIKRYAAQTGREYPDGGCSFETFTNESFLELETLGPLETLHPGQTARHVEAWTLHKDVKINSWSDAAIDEALLPRL